MSEVRIIAEDGSTSGLRVSPGGFEFGLQGWSPGEQRPRSITFFLNGTVLVADQHGKAIRGAVVDGRNVWFAVNAPVHDDPDDGYIVVRVGTGTAPVRTKLATHAEVIAALEADRVDWRKLVWAGWPQLPYEELKRLPTLPPTPIEELRKIKDGPLRRDALRARREFDEVRTKELQATEAEE